MGLSQAASWARRAKRDADSNTADAVETLAKAVIELVKEVQRLESKIAAR